MTDWHQFLAEQPLALPRNNGSSSFVTPLTDLGLIAFGGDDAASFLHGQLTNDVTHLDAEHARLAGYCSPKGRLMASLLVWRDADTIFLQIDRELQAAIQKRLQMFVLRSKVHVADATDSVAMIGLAGNDAAATLAHWFPTLPDVPYAKITTSAGTLIRVADAGEQARYQWITRSETAIAAWPTLCKSLTVVQNDQWRLTEIIAAIPHITLPTQEKFVPQMINFEAIGGVDFRKGCYPGQEIVARSQYLGKLKRRMLPATVDATGVEAGLEVFAASDSAQPCGMIVNAAADAYGRTHCLVEVKTAIVDNAHDTVHLSPGGPQLVFGALPYLLPDSI